MVVKFGKLNKFELPLMTLCNPGAALVDDRLLNVQGVITDHEAEEISFNFNAISELEMRVNMVERGSSIYDAETRNVYNKIQNRRLIFIEDIGFFVITNVVDSYDNGKYYKDIEAKSVDYELKSRGIPYIADGTYAFNDLLNTIMSKFPLWDVENVRVAPAVSARSRTFESVEIKTTCYDFMMDSMQKMYDCFFVFDIMNRGIIVYDRKTYKELPDIKTNIYLSKKDIVNTVKMDENADELYTALNVYSNTNVSISDVNPIGTSCIYNFDYYKTWFSPGLRTRVEEWEAAIEASEREYQELCRMKEMNEINISFTQSKIDQTNLLIEYYKKCKKNVNALSDTPDYGVLSDYNASISSYKEALIYATGYLHNGTFYKNRINYGTENNPDYRFSDPIEEYDGRYYKDISDADTTTVYICNKKIDFSNSDVDQDERSAVWTGHYDSNTKQFFVSFSGSGNGIPIEIDNVIVRDTDTNVNHIGEYKTEYEAVAGYFDDDAIIVDGYYNGTNFYKRIRVDLADNTHFYDQIEKVNGKFYLNMLSENYSIYYYSESGNSFIRVETKQVVLARFNTLIGACEDKLHDLDLLLYADNASGTGYISRRVVYNNRISDIVINLKPDIYFAGSINGVTYYDELRNYIFETDFVDEDIIITDNMTVWDQFKQKRQLLGNGRNKLKEISTPTIKIEVDTESFIFDKNFKQWSEQIETGCLIEVDLTSSTTEVILTNLTINYDDHKIKMEFGSDYNKFDVSTLYNNLFKTAQRNDKLTSYLADALAAFSAKATNTGQDVTRFYLS